MVAVAPGGGGGGGGIAVLPNLLFLVPVMGGNYF